MTTEYASGELNRRFGAIYTGALTDVLYDLGYGAQGLPPQVQAIKLGELPRVAGPAFPVERRPFVSSKPVDEAAVGTSSAPSRGIPSRSMPRIPRAGQ